jgi:hypothetical protein
MRIWFSIPFIKRTRIGFSVSDQELRRAFRGVPSPRLTEEQQAEIERKSQAFAKRWTPFVSKVIVVLIVIALVALAWWTLSAALAGTCHVYADGEDTVTACDNGAYTVIDKHGRKHVYGTPNAGFERYPGQEGRPVWERRED